MLSHIFEKLYLKRFSQNDRKIRQRLWRTLCAYFFQKFISPEDTVVDMGAGFCEFINAINCKNKIAIDKMNIAKFAAENVKVFESLDDLSPNSADIIFMCNFLEHLVQMEDIFTVLEKAKRTLKERGKVIIMGPNMRFAYRDYWDFIDHRLALTDLSLSEALNTLDFKVIKQVPKFLPFTIKSKYPKWNWLVQAYLGLPFLWKIFGKQYLIICEKSMPLSE